MNPIQVIFLLFFFIVAIKWIFNIIIEPLYVLIYKKPIYIHFYPIPRKLTPPQRKILEQEFIFYRKLSDRRKRFFEHRVATFITKYQFAGKQDLVVTDQMKMLIAATSVMLSFGMRGYLVDVFDKIIIYPNIYFSTVNQVYHKGEFNPRMKALVFSWEDFQQGYLYENDNLNLGLHEFAHALHFHGLKGRDQSSIIFSDAYVEIKKYVAQQNILDHLVESNYFRIYAYTNQVEFLAVILEHFFETPQDFKREFPVLFEKVRSMINYREK